MKQWVIGSAALGAVLLCSSPSQAQTPGIPGIPGAGASAIPGAAAVPAAPAAPTSNLWSFLCPTQQQCQQCLDKLCACPLVQFLQGALTPLSMVSGGMLPGLCPGPNQANPADLLKPSDSAEGAASRIKKSEAEAKARRAACRYLGTVDCRRFPEAEAALIASLRGDSNECVRIEAALALGNGCCCTKKVLEALVATVAGKRGNEPAESSLRVKVAAAFALERCLKRYCEIEIVAPDEKSPEPPRPGAPTPAGATPPAPGAQARSARMPLDPLAEEGKRVLAQFRAAYLIQGPLPVPNPDFTGEPPRLQPIPIQQPIQKGLSIIPIMTRPVAATPGTPETRIDLTVSNVLAPTPTIVTEMAPAPLAVTLPQQAPQKVLPPTGQRDVWSLFRHSLRTP